MKAITNWEPVSLTPFKRVVTVKQYKLPVEHKEIGETIQKLHQVGIVRYALSASNSWYGS